MNPSFKRLLLRSLASIITLLVIIALVMVVRRTLILTGLINPPALPSGKVAGHFALYPVLTFVHIIPGALFLILAPLQFLTRICSHFPWFHRWSGRVLVLLAIIIGVTALLMSFRKPIGGANGTAATVVFSIFFLLALIKAVYHILKHEIALHREWMLRMFAIGLAIATVRPIVGMFFAFSHLSPQEFFGIAFWLGFTLHLVIAEVWINYTRNL